MGSRAWPRSGPSPYSEARRRWSRRHSQSPSQACDRRSCLRSRAKWGQGRWRNSGRGRTKGPSPPRLPQSQAPPTRPGRRRGRRSRERPVPGAPDHVPAHPASARWPRAAGPEENAQNPRGYPTCRCDHRAKGSGGSTSCMLARQHVFLSDRRLSDSGTSVSPR